MTILIADDEETLVLGLRKSLVREGYSVITASDGESCIRQLAAHQVDLVILDVMMPKLDGMAVCRRVRERSEVPIVMLTARDDVVDRVLGLEYGADDYVTKPFHTRELLARIRTVLRRAARSTGDAGTVSVGGVALDRARRSAERDGASVDLSAREFDLLFILMSNPMVVFTRDQLLAELRQGEDVDGRSIDVHVSRIREKVEPDPSRPQFLMTKWGVGYYVSDSAPQT